MIIIIIIVIENVYFFMNVYRHENRYENVGKDVPELNYR